MTIAIASQKGGSGKTTTSLTLAAGLGRRNKRTLLIDIDSQANSSKVLVPNYQELRREQTVCVTILDRQPLVIHKTALAQVDIVASHILLSNTDIELTTAKDHREERLRRELSKVQAQYDYIIIDCPPALSWLTINAFTAANGVLIPVAPGYFELDSIVQINKTMNEVREYYNPSLRLLGYVFVMSDPTLNSKTSLKILRQTYTDSVLRTVIPRNTDIRDAHFNKQDIFSFSPLSKSAQAYQHLLDELGL
jgi:chromosome partitioning protein